MNNDFYSFKPDDVEMFKRATGNKAKVVGSEMVFAYCPYCRGGKHRDKDTFSVSLVTGQFECKRSSCSARGNMITLAKDFASEFSLGREVTTYYNINNAQNKFKKFKDAHKKIEVRPAAVEYLVGRGISEQTCRKYEITTKPNQKNILVFPFKDESGDLQYVKYRNTEYKKGQGNKEWCEKNCKPILFGMNQCEDFTTLVITEGQIDSLSCAEAGVKNAVSVPTGKNGFTWRPNVWDWMLKFDEIVIFGDNEGGHITLAKEMSSFPKRVRVVNPKDYKGCKDANELLQKEGKAAVIKAVENAEVKVSLRIKNLADVEKVDLSKITAYKTGFPTLDKVIGRGFHEGEVIILTGKAGEGKSTFASMIVGRMIEQNVKCFCYSGELPDYMFKAWLDYQIAGTKQLTEAKRNALDAWYDKKCYIYDNSSLVDEAETLFDVMNQAVRDLKCKFILLDNLMTAMEDKPDMDLYRQQSNFLNKLTKFAKGFNVIILLIAHPKKGTSIDNDSIAGSGDITNRANLVLRFQRKDKNSNNVSKLMITKNRTTGILDYDGILLDYDDSSMRLLESGGMCEEFIHEEGFEPTISQEMLDEIPF